MWVSKEEDLGQAPVDFITSHLLASILCFSSLFPGPFVDGQILNFGHDLLDGC